MVDAFQSTHVLPPLGASYANQTIVWSFLLKDDRVWPPFKPKHAISLSTFENWPITIKDFYELESVEVWRLKLCSPGSILYFRIVRYVQVELGHGDGPQCIERRSVPLVRQSQDVHHRKHRRKVFTCSRSEQLSNLVLSQCRERRRTDGQSLVQSNSLQKQILGEE